jgi:hypothetical protein
MPQMKTKIIARIGLEYIPPTLKIEYKNGQLRRIPMKTYIDRYASGYPRMSAVERSMKIKAIVKALLEKHYELQQIPSKTLERMIEKLYSYHTQNNYTITDTITGTSADEEDLNEQSTYFDYGDADRDDNLDRILDDTRDHTLDHTSGRGTFDTQVRDSNV